MQGVIELFNKLVAYKNTNMRLLYEHVLRARASFLFCHVICQGLPWLDFRKKEIALLVIQSAQLPSSFSEEKRDGWRERQQSRQLATTEESKSFLLIDN